MTGLLVGLVLIGSVIVLLCAGRVRRLHRLHIRTDAARAGFDAALRRRSAVAARVLGPLDPVPADLLPADLLPADLLPADLGPDREIAENALGHRLAGVDRAAVAPALRAELADAERLVVLGRSVYHDAVRDTRALRSRRLVRWLHLAGTAPLPGYFEIADPTVTSASTAGDGPAPDVASGVP